MLCFMLNKKINEQIIAKKVERIIKNEENKKVYLIIDGDKTFSESDSTIKFCEYAEINFDVILGFFKNYNYSFKNFYQVACFYSSIEEKKYTKASVMSVKHVLLYKELVELIKKYQEKVAVIVVTAGVRLLWEKILAKNKLKFVHLLGGNYLKQDEYIIDKRSKGQIVNLLKKNKKKVLVFGDSLVDEEMLKKADYGFLVVNKNMNHCIIKRKSISSNKISQISFNGKFHSHISRKTIKDVEFYLRKYTI